MDLDEILYRKLSREQAEAARDNSQPPSLDISDMDINELRKFTEFLYAQYIETKEANEQMTVTLMNLNSELYENRKLLAEIKKTQEKTEREKSKLQSQLSETSDRIAGLMVKTAEKQSELVKEITELRRALSDKDAQIAILRTQMYSTKSHKRKNRNDKPGRDDKKDEHDGTQPQQEAEEPENDPNAEEKEESKSEKGEKEERPNRKGMTYKKGCNETNVIKHYSDKKQTASRV